MADGAAGSRGPLTGREALLVQSLPGLEEAGQELSVS